MPATASRPSAVTADLIIAGGGLAGCEAAWRAAANGARCRLVEMKPLRFSPAHRNPDLAELVCSNSLRSDDPENAVGLLHEELRRLGSIVMLAADRTRVRAGTALAVDRSLFSAEITALVSRHPLIEVVREEFRPPLDPSRVTVVAAGPLATDALAENLAEIAGAAHLHFYDAIAPVVTKDSLDLGVLYEADRFDRGTRDHLNAPMTEAQFEAFAEALSEADRCGRRPFEEAAYFEGCLPIEVMAQRGARTLAHGPMRPVGLIDPRTGIRPHAVVQLRREDEAGTHWNLIGFQTRLTRPAQEKVLRLIPGLERAQFARHGAIHRNTHLAAPAALDPMMALKNAPSIFVAGQLSGVEGYVESAAQGLWAGENAARRLLGLPMARPPRATALGSLLWHLSGEGPARKGGFAPSNVNFGLFPETPPEVPKRQRAAWRLGRAREELGTFLGEIGYRPAPSA
jgi:methylenetetrahydrofolate--tRNA-(uracil-5-)-methyltransferase